MKIKTFQYEIRFVWHTGGGATYEYPLNIVPHIPIVGEWIMREGADEVQDKVKAVTSDTYMSDDDNELRIFTATIMTEPLNSANLATGEGYSVV